MIWAAINTKESGGGAKEAIAANTGEDNHSTSHQLQPNSFWVTIGWIKGELQSKKGEQWREQKKRIITDDGNDDHQGNEERIILPSTAAESPCRQIWGKEKRGEECRERLERLVGGHPDNLNIPTTWAGRSWSKVEAMQVLLQTTMASESLRDKEV